MIGGRSWYVAKKAKQPVTGEGADHEPPRPHPGIARGRYERVRRAAKGMNQSVEKALVDIVRAATPSLEKVPAEYRAELEGMEDLGDDELWGISRSRFAPVKQRRIQRLLDKNQRGELTDRERQALAELRSAGDRLMLRRSYAALLLK